MSSLQLARKIVPKRTSRKIVPKRTSVPQAGFIEFIIAIVLFGIQLIVLFILHRYIKPKVGIYL